MLFFSKVRLIIIIIIQFRHGCGKYVGLFVCPHDGMDIASSIVSEFANATVATVAHCRRANMALLCNSDTRQTVVTAIHCRTVVVRARDSRQSLSPVIPP